MPFTVSERPLIATAEAPPSVGNIATGFDILGHTIEGPRDRVRVRRIAETVVRLGSVQGVITDLPRETDRNFGFNLSCWDRIFGTYQDQPRLGHDRMTIGLTQFRDPRELRLDRMLLQPFAATQR